MKNIKDILINTANSTSEEGVSVQFPSYMDGINKTTERKYIDKEKLKEYIDRDTDNVNDTDIIYVFKEFNDAFQLVAIHSALKEKLEYIDKLISILLENKFEVPLRYVDERNKILARLKIF